MNKERVKYWIELADYDFGTAVDMQKSKRWLYVGFMCHQAIEKTLKAYWCATQENDPPYTHNIIRLVQESGLKDVITAEQLSFIAEMMPLNIQTRYPEYKDQLFKQLSEERCKQIIETTKSTIEWIKTKL